MYRHLYCPEIYLPITKRHTGSHKKKPTKDLSSIFNVIHKEALAKRLMKYFCKHEIIKKINDETEYEYAWMRVFDTKYS